MDIKTVIIRKEKNKSRISVSTDKKEYSFVVDVPADIAREYRKDIEEFLRNYLKDKKDITKADRAEIKKHIIELTNTETFKTTSEDSKTQDVNEIVHNKVIDLIFKIDTKDDLLGAYLMAFGDALAYLRGYPITKPPTKELYIGEGYDYKDDTYIYVIVTPDLDVEFVIDKKE